MHRLPFEPGEQLRLTAARRLAAAVAAALVACAAASAQGPDEPMTGRVIAVTTDGRVDIDIGDSRLKGGDVGVIQRDGAQVGLASVLWVDLGSTRLRVTSLVPGQEAKVGDTVVFVDKKNAPRADPAPTPPADRPSAGPGTLTQANDDFVPLLAPVAAQKTALARTSAVFHGRLRAAEVYQSVAPMRAWYSSSRLDSDGSVERLGGGAWSLAWAGNASRRDGSVISTADDYRKVSAHLYRGALTRKGDAGGFLRLGRFFPSELSALGYVDGVQADAPVAAGLRVGAAGGDRPDRMNMGFSDRERIAAAYATVEAGEPRKLYYSGSVGALQTFYLSKRDELAALWDQRADLGPKLNVFSTLQFDFPAGSAVEHTGTRLTRANISLNSPVSDRLSARAGASHFEPLDTAVDRALAGGTTFYLNNGYWRYWTGSGQILGPGWNLDEDLSFTNTVGAWTPGQWRLTLGRRGLPGLANASLNVAAYSLYNPAGPDYGGTVSGGVPVLHDRLTFDGTAGARLGPTSVAHRRFWVSDASLHANWRANDAWTFDAGVTRNWQESLHSTIANGGVTWRW